MATPILITPGSRFTCVPCGFCCGYWDIHIDQQRKDSLESKDWVGTLSQKQGHQSLFRVLGQSDVMLLQRQHGSCSFLDNRMLCSIHATDGFNAKPLVCQQYPNIYFETPRGVEVFLDYSCPEVIRNTGEPVICETVEKTLPQEYVHKITPCLPLNSKTTLDWEGYLRLEKAFSEVLGKPLTYEEKILSLDQLTRELGQKLQTQTSAQGKDVEEALTQIDAGSPSDSCSKIRQFPSNPSKRDLYLAILVQWVEATFSSEVNGVAMGAGKVLRNILKQWKEIGEHTFSVFKFRLNYKQMRDVNFYIESVALRDPLDRYLEYQIKSLVGTGKIPFTRRLAIIATNFALVKWFSRAYAASNGRSQVSLEDVVFAIKVVEKFLSNRLFNKLNEQSGFLSGYINFLFENPALPSTMLSTP
jgi:lysine-N-methylase